MKYPVKDTDIPHVNTVILHKGLCNRQELGNALLLVGMYFLICEVSTTKILLTQQSTMTTEIQLPTIHSLLRPMLPPSFESFN